MTLTLAILGKTFVFMHYLYQTYTSPLNEFELLATRLTDLRARNVETLHIDISSYIDMTCHIHLEILNMSYMHLGQTF